MRLMLHDDYSLGQTQDENLKVWPPILWNDFRPNSNDEILNHYYAYSSGCKTPTIWGLAATSAGAVAAAAFGPALLAGAKSALGAIKLKGLFTGATKSISGLNLGTKKLLANEAIQSMSKQVEGQAKMEAQKAANTAKQKARRRLDSGSERNRIVENYRRQYAKLVGNQFQGRVGAMSLPELEAELKNQKRILKASADKCKKTPCDTAGCRSMGVLTARMQYVQALIAAYKETGTKTPLEYEAKFSDKALKGETNMAGFGLGGMVPLLIIGGLLLSRLKK